MTIPKSIKILGKRINIKWVKNLTDDYKPSSKKRGGAECDGLFCASTFTIYLDSELRGNPEKAFHTLVHECFHALVARLYLPGMSEDMEEVLAENVAHLVAETILNLLE